MVIGVGLDLASVSYWDKMAKDPASSVIEGTFTPAEIQRAQTHVGEPAERLASRFAAKEAFVKALSGSNLHQKPVVALLDKSLIEVSNDPHGRPYLVLHGEAKMVAERLGVRHIWLSCSHEADFAAAVVILEG